MPHEVHSKDFHITDDMSITEVEKEYLHWNLFKPMAAHWPTKDPWWYKLARCQECRGKGRLGGLALRGSPFTCRMCEGTGRPVVVKVAPPKVIV